MGNTNNNDLKIAILENEIKNMKERDKDYREFTEARLERQEKRLDKLEEADDILQREATNGERNKFGVWVTVILGLGSTIVGAILTFLLSKFK
jgi:hypothetical protein